MTADSAPIDRVLRLLPDVRRSGNAWQARCPAHDDRMPSLSVSEGHDRQVILKCHAGCDTGAVLLALGLDWSDLYPEPAGRGFNGGLRRELIATYDYVALDGHVVAQKLRYFPKDFRQRRPDGNGGYLWNLKGVTPPLYNLPDVRMALAEALPVWVVEGEKDADVLAAKGEIATTNIGGAGKWRPEDGAAFAGGNVVVVADRDDIGRKHALTVARSIAPAAASLRVVESDRGKDTAEHFERGGGFGDFVTVDWWPETEAPAPAEKAWTAMSTIAPTRVRWLWDKWLPRRKLCLLDGDPGTAKSTLALDLAARVTTGTPMPGERADSRGDPASVVLLTAEDGLDDTVVPRLLVAGADLDRVHTITQVRTVTEDGKLAWRLPELPTDVDTLADAVVSTGAALVIVDVLMAFLSGGVNSWRDGDIRHALAPVHNMADATGCVVLFLRHLNKSGTGPAIYRGGGSIGLAGAARSLLIAGHDPRDAESTTRNVLACGKSNLGPRATSLAYEVVVDPVYQVSRIVWNGHCDVTADQLTTYHPPKSVGAIDDAVAWLGEFLSEGAVDYQDIRRAATANGISESTLRRARERSGVVVRRVGVGKLHRSTWALQGDDDPTPASPDGTDSGQAGTTDSGPTPAQLLPFRDRSTERAETPATPAESSTPFFSDEEGSGDPDGSGPTKSEDDT